MRTLTNNYQDVEVWNLDSWSGARGPFLVVQMGVPPGRENAGEGVYFLRPDGSWVDATHYMASGKPELLDEAVFGTTQEVMGLLAQLDPEAKVAETEVDEEALRSALARAAGQNPMERCRLWLEGYRRRRSGQSS